MAPMRSSPALAAAREIAHAPEPAQAPPRAEAAPEVRLQRFEDLVALAGKHRDVQMRYALERQVRVVRFEEGQLEIQPTDDAPPGLAGAIAKKLQDWTGARWMVAVAAGEGAPTLHERAEAEAAARLEGVQAHPHVRAILDSIPGAVIVDVRTRAEPALDAAEEHALAAPEEDDEL
jgi:DNA polymerase-3 subunit gamma/tau